MPSVSAISLMFHRIVPSDSPPFLPGESARVLEHEQISADIVKELGNTLGLILSDISAAVNVSGYHLGFQCVFGNCLECFLAFFFISYAILLQLDLSFILFDSSSLHFPLVRLQCLFPNRTALLKRPLFAASMRKSRQPSRELSPRVTKLCVAFCLSFGIASDARYI